MKMGRKRKVPVVDEEKENAIEDESAVTANSSSTLLHGPMYTIMSNVQLNETFHKRYIKEMKQLYTKMDHDAFMFTFIKMIKSAMEADENNEYAYTTLLFCAKFVSSYDDEETHTVLADSCKWLLTTISNNPHIRFRLCQFVNMILNALGQEAALDDTICDQILEYMLERLRDMSPSVRVQATLAMQRLQVPENPDDPVLRAYQFHLCSDPSPRVRQTVITCMGRNYHTIPYILDRLWDIDEKVRRHTYLHMSSYPVRSYKVSQRLTLLEQGLNDRSESVRKVVITIMLKQWIESYQKDLTALISALKLDSNDAEICRFRKIAKLALKEIYNIQTKEELLACLPVEEEGEFYRCVPHDKLTIEIAIYWQCLTDQLQSTIAEELDLVVPELSNFCAYVEKYCEIQKPEMDQFEQMEFQYILLSLMEILYTFDLGDEIGRGNLQKLLAHLLKTYTLNEKVIEIVIRCAENLITDQNTRLQFFAEIIRDMCDLKPKQNDTVRDLMNELLANSTDDKLKCHLSSQKVKLMDLDEQETNYLKSKNYVRAQEIAVEKNAVIEKLMPLLEKHTTVPSQWAKTTKNEGILKSLQIIFYMVVSPKVNSLNPSICNLYTDFICRHIASSQILIRVWALKCGTAYSMLYETLAKDVFDELYAQFFKNHNIHIWETAITCIFELLGRYGVDSFDVQESQIKSKKSGRQLYNTLECLDSEDDARVSMGDQGAGVIHIMSHFLDTCDDICILRALIKGFCCLIIRGFINNNGIMEKLLLRYFNPTTDVEMNQMLGVFLETLIARKQQILLQPCLLPIITTVMSASYDSPLHEVRPETITRFMIDAMRQECSSNSANVHNKVAMSFLQEMLTNANNKELCKLLAKELLTLELNIVQHEELKKEMREMSEKLIKAEFDPKTVKNIINFKDMLDSGYKPQRKTVNENESDDESKSDDETTTTATIERERLSQSLAPARDKNTPERVASPAKTSEQSERTETTLSEETTLTKQPTTAAPETGTTADANETTTSPSANVPTTYGKDNVVGHRFLRKSLNLSRSQSDPEIGDGPSRPNKIRIEARIDSDKKAQQQESPPTAKTSNTSVRRNLRFTQRNAESSPNKRKETRQNTPSKKRNNERQQGRQDDAVEAGAEAEEQESETDKTASNAEDENEEQSVQNETVQRKSSSPSKIRSPVQERNETATRATKLPTRVNTRHATRAVDVTKSKSSLASTTRTDGDDVDGDESDTIPPSPETRQVDSSRLTASRLRRALHNSTHATTDKDSVGSGSGSTINGTKSPLRRTRSAAVRETRIAAAATVATTRSKTSTSTVDNRSTTPVRNGRKRILQTATPKNTTNRISPLRKQQRTDAQQKSPQQSKTKQREQQKQQEVESQSSQNPTETSTQPTCDNGGGSPSSTKENQAATSPNNKNNNKSTVTTATSKKRELSSSASKSITESISQPIIRLRRSLTSPRKSVVAVNATTTTTTASSTTTVTRSRSRSMSGNSTSNKQKSVQSPLPNATRKRRLSLERSSSSSDNGGGNDSFHGADSSSESTSQTNRKTHRAKSSRIPVRKANSSAKKIARRAPTTSSLTVSQSSSDELQLTVPTASSAAVGSRLPRPKVVQSSTQTSLPTRKTRQTAVESKASVITISSSSTAGNSVTLIPATTSTTTTATTGTGSGTSISKTRPASSTATSASSSATSITTTITRLLRGRKC